MASNLVLTVREAADRLGVNEQRVRALINAGRLRARKVGGRWLIDSADVDMRRDGGVAGHRPFRPANAWAVLCLAARSPRSAPRPPGSFGTRVARWRRRRRFEGKSVSGALLDLLPVLHTRGRLHRLRAHPGDVPRVIEEPHIVRTGVSAAADYGADIVAPGVAEFYVAQDRLSDLAARYLLEPSNQPNVLLRAVEGPWPFPPGCRVAPISAVALDLLEASDERTRRAGRELLSRLDEPES